MVKNNQRYLPSAILLLMTVLRINTAWACATCLCGDPTITTMGTEKPFAGRMRVSVDYLTREEVIGLPYISKQTVQEERMTYNFSYALNEKWIFAASVPLVDKQVKRFDLSEDKASGIGDTDLSARWFIGDDNSFPAKNLWGVQFGVRVPTSKEKKSRGTAIDFDAQPGAGATIPSVGVWYGRYQMPWFFYTSAVVQHAMDEGYQAYQAGDVLLATGHAQYAVNYQWALQLSLDGRFKERDSYNNVTDNDSGGMLIMASPGVAWTPIEDLVVNVSYQIPAIDKLNGEQEEKNVLRIGVAYDI